MARMHPELRFITMSPGNTAGTEALRDQPALVRIIASRILLPYLAPALRIGHKLDVGAKRLVNAVTDASLQSGVFYASAAKHDHRTGHRPGRDRSRLPRPRDPGPRIRGDPAVRTEGRRDLTLCAPAGTKPVVASRNGCGTYRAPGRRPPAPAVNLSRRPGRPHGSRDITLAGAKDRYARRQTTRRSTSPKPPHEPASHQQVGWSL